MTIRINLLPNHERKIRWPFTLLFGSATAIVVAGFFAIGGLLSYQSTIIEEQLTTAKKQYELLQPVQAVMQSSAAKNQQLKAKQTTLIKLTRERPLLSPAFDHVSAALTDKVWLTDFEFDWSKKQLIISGISRTYGDVAEFIKRLEQDELFANHRLNKSERAVGEVQTVFLRFQITMTVRG